MNITALSVQQKDTSRINVFVDGKYRFSLDIAQIGDLGVKVGREYTEAEMAHLEKEGQFGKLYSRALEYCFIRPRSAREVRDYLYRKTRATRTKTGDIKEGYTVELTARVFARLAERGYIDDEKFTRYWVENRHVTKGVSRRKLEAELLAKGVDRPIIERCLGESPRNENEELKKIIHKKRHRYADEQKLIMYLARQGFSYDTIKGALAEIDSEAE